MGILYDSIEHPMVNFFILMGAILDFCKNYKFNDESLDCPEVNLDMI